MNDNENFDWSVRYRCDCCGEDQGEWFYDFSRLRIRGLKPICICERCAEEMKVSNEG